MLRAERMSGEDVLWYLEGIERELEALNKLVADLVTAVEVLAGMRRAPKGRAPLPIVMAVEALEPGPGKEAEKSQAEEEPDE